MASASLPLLVPPGSCVRLDSREHVEEEDHALRLRMEPVPGCSTTAEAVARALGGLESSASAMESVLEALKRMTALQAEFDPATLARSRGQGAMFATGRHKFGTSQTLQRAVAGGERT
ncbi:hypothetical protein H632_c2255p0 [Helicosporidium sp. ATCC 50920]|nr:hypothetical protein H632_c2255p0 [Helicosporidium sp. ATCC 50920]|eukprot:KDD73362.1 hypothetical protein H632_c2255p0 [Helicosporidium sp. ATCC 50920]